MNTSIEVRRIRVSGGDATEQYRMLEDIVRLQQEAFGFSEADLVPAYGMEMTGWTFGLYDQGVLVGFALCCLVDDEEGLTLILQQLGVKKEFQRHRHGTRLMHEIIRQAKACPLRIHRIKWCQDPLLARVGRFYIGEQVPGCGRRIVRNRYGVLTGNYQGLPSHRLEVVLDLEKSDHPPQSFESRRLETVFDVERLSLGAAPTPRLSVINSEHPAGVGLLVPIPRDFEALKLEAPTVAAGWQESVIGVMDTLCRLGRRAVNLRKSEDSRFAEYLFNL